MSQGGSLTHVIVENKSGRLALKAKAFVDATGDADLCRLAGEKTAEYTQNRKSGWYFLRRATPVRASIRLQNRRWMRHARPAPAVIG